MEILVKALQQIAGANSGKVKLNRKAMILIAKIALEDYEAAKHRVQRTCAKCGNAGKPITDIGGNQSCPECGASR